MLPPARPAVRSAKSQKPLIELLESRTLASASPSPAAPRAAPHASTISAARAALRSVQQAQLAAMPLTAVRSFSYDLADLSNPKDVATMARTNFDMLIVDPTVTYKGDENFDMSAMVAQLHADHPGRVVLAYLNIGEAANFRTYWRTGWKPPHGGHAANPSYLLEADPYGWSNEYPTAYWNKTWQNLFLGSNGIVNRVMKAGFDGVFLDWIGAYNDPAVAAAAGRAGINPATAMVNFISRIRANARNIDPRASVVGLNAEDLAAADPAYINAVDAVAFENTWFSGSSNVPWDDPGGGDIPTDSFDAERRIAEYQTYQAAGKPVFTIDYALQSDNASYAYQQSTNLGFVPLVTQISVGHLTGTPPPSLA